MGVFGRRVFAFDFSLGLYDQLNVFIILLSFELDGST